MGKLFKVRKKMVIVLLFIMLYIGVRLVVMISSETLIRQGQETQVGCLTQSIIDGWGFNCWRYPVNQYIYGSVLNALIAVPFFYLFGPHMMSLMLASLLFHMCGLALLFYLISEHFSLRAAIFSCLLYIFSPPLLTARALIFTGAHAETVVFGIVIFFLFFKILQEKPSIVWYALFGFISGLSIWYISSNGIFIISCFIIWIFLDRTFFLKKKMGLYYIGFLVGITPLLLFRFANPYMGTQLHRNALVSLANIPDVSAILVKFKEILCTVLPNMFLFNEFTPFLGKYFDIFYYSIFMLSLLGLIVYTVSYDVIMKTPRGNKFKACYSADKICLFKIAAIISVPIIFSLLYAVSKRPIENFGYGIADYRYTLMIFPFVFICISLWLDILCCSKKIVVKYIGYSVYISLVIINVIGLSGFVYSYDFKNNYLLDSACNYELIGRVAARRFDTHIDHAMRMISSLKNSDYESEAYRGYGETLANKYIELHEIKKCDAVGKKIENKLFRGEYYRGVGIGFADIFFSDVSTLERSIKQYDRAIDNPSDTYNMYRGLLDVLINRPRSQFSVDSIIASIPSEYRSIAYFKTGLKMGSFVFGKPSLEETVGMLQRIPKSNRRYYINGVGAGIAVFFTGDEKKCSSKINRFPSEMHAWLWQGVGMYRCFQQYGRVDDVQDLLVRYGISKEEKTYFAECAMLLMR